MSDTLLRVNISAHFNATFTDLAEGLEKYIRGKDLNVLPRTIPTASKLFVNAYEFNTYHGRLPELPEKYQELKARIAEVEIRSSSKLRELYKKTTSQELKDEREIGIMAVKFLGLLENLATNGAKENKKEREKYKILLKFSRALVEDSEGEVNHRCTNEDDE